ncbi:MAG: hypothetical protein OXJ64_01380 [Boseongicola sp.]|nr:hypothetical protein [Boseongicola sp.]
MLLTPEVLDIGEIRASLGLPHRENRIQLERACFTLVDRRELRVPKYDTVSGTWFKDGLTHFERFGEFAIGVDLAQARKLGATPVFYYYESDDDDSGAVSVPEQMLLCLHELRELAISLAGLEARAYPDDVDIYSEEQLERVGYILSSEKELHDAISDTSVKEAFSILDRLPKKRGPAWNFVDLLSMMFNFFQKADDPRAGLASDWNLEYYRQREWRITRFFAPGTGFYRLGSRSDLDCEARFPDDLQSRLRRALLEFDADHFAGPYFDKCLLLYSTNNKPFFDCVREVIVPRDTVLRDEVACALVHFEHRFRPRAEADRYVFSRAG